MSPDRLDEILKNHRVTKSRYAYLKETLEMLNRQLEQCEKTAVSDSISLSQAITGMPHGSGTGDPTGRLGIDLASGEAGPFVKELKIDIYNTRKEMQELEAELRIIGIVMDGLKDREAEVLTMKIIDGKDWTRTLCDMNRIHNNSYSKRSLQRLLDRALEKAYAIVA